jgi:hypothetical protein
VARHARSLPEVRRHALFYETAVAGGLKEEKGESLQDWVHFWADHYEEDLVFCDAVFVSVFGDMIGAHIRVLWCAADELDVLKGQDPFLCEQGGKEDEVSQAPSLHVGWINGNHYVPLFGNFLELSQASGVAELS